MSERDKYSWKPLVWAIFLAGFTGTGVAFSDFVPCCTPERYDPLDIVISLVTSLAIPLFFITSIYAIVLCIVLIYFAIRLRWRRALSFRSAIIAVPLIFYIVIRCGFFDPYYWHIIWNQARFVDQATTKTAGDLPIFAVIEGNDVSSGLVINGNILATIVYDESDQLGLDQSKRSAEWTARHGHFLDIENAPPEIYSIKHLHGHFYLVLHSY